MSVSSETGLMSGATQSGLRNHNERLILSMIRQLAPVPASDLARQVNLSAQTVSVIVRDLERDGILTRGDPVRGRVGKPSIPMMLAADGAFSVGLRIGRRTADLALMDLSGRIRGQKLLTYRYPRPDAIAAFLREGLPELTALVPEPMRPRIRGLGLAMPFEIWKWAEAIGAPAEEIGAWNDIDFPAEIARMTDLPVHLMNDATAACRAEHHFGAGTGYRDYAYFFVGSFIGGGVALNGVVLDGNQGNAGALGSLQCVDAGGRPVQLIDRASLHLLESRIAADGHDPARMWDRDEDWSRFEPHVENWIAESAREMARASLSACAVLDFEAVIVDGAFPPGVRARLVAAIRAELDLLDARGVYRPAVVEGRVGQNARVTGAAFAPISEGYFLNAGAF